jgi:hypothetical protein
VVIFQNPAGQPCTEPVYELTPGMAVILLSRTKNPDIRFVEKYTVYK